MKNAFVTIDPPKLPKKRRAPPRIVEYLRGNIAPEFDKDITTGKITMKL